MALEDIAYLAAIVRIFEVGIVSLTILGVLSVLVKFKTRIAELAAQECGDCHCDDVIEAVQFSDEDETKQEEQGNEKGC